jgi:tellurite methyltransferase
LVDFENYLRNRLTARNANLAEATIQTRLRAIKMLTKRVNLWDSEEVQRYIDDSPWSNGRREQVSLAYWDWCNLKGFKFERKTYYRETKIPEYFGEPYPELVSFFKEYEPKGTVLDLGCGQGRDSITLAMLGYQVIGVDISKVGVSQMLSVAEKESLDVEGIIADMYEYTVDDSIDVVLLDSMLHFYPRDREKETRFLKRIMSELKHSGLLCVIVWKSKKIESVLESILESYPHWKTLFDRYIMYPEKDMEMRMLVIEKS